MNETEIRNLKRQRDLLLEEREAWRRTHMTLTDEEREAIEIAIPFLPDGPYTEYDGTPRPDRRATLRALLERTQ